MDIHVWNMRCHKKIQLNPPFLLNSHTVVYLCDMRNINACPSACLFQLENGWTNFDYILCCRSTFNFNLNVTHLTAI